MSDWVHRRLAQEYINDRRREAEQWRLVQQALAAKRHNDPIYRRVLRWLGYQLVAWGKQLQKRFGEPRRPMRLDMEKAEQ